MRAGNFLTVVVLLGLLTVSCNQNNIFQIIASETAPRKPRIEGAPTNMVVFHREYSDIDEPVPIMCVASGRLHWYAKAPDAGELDAPKWDLGTYRIPQPAGKIISLAVTKNDAGGERLYALCRDGNGVNARLRYIESNGEKWETIPSEASGYPVIQSIYADPESSRLFAGAGKNDQNQATYAILYLDNKDNKLKLLKGGTSIFSGAIWRKKGAEDIYYLSTRGGIFQISEGNLTTNTINTTTVTPLVEEVAENESGNNNRMFMSMIKLKGTDTIIAVERNGGALYEVKDGSFERMVYNAPNNNDRINIGKYATGAITLWEEIDPESGDTTKMLLVVGIQGGLYSTTTSSHTYGYVEFELNEHDEFKTITRRCDPGSLMSVDYQDRYTTSLGKHPVNHLFQTPHEIDPDMTFFASTQTAGLWSYRDRPDNGGLQWNAEE